MSRVGKKPIEIPKGCEVKLAENRVIVKGKLGELTFDKSKNINIQLDNNMIQVTRVSDIKKHRELHGMTRAIINNMIIGVTKGYKKSLEFNWPAGKIKMEGKKLKIDANYRTFILEPPDSIKVDIQAGKKIEVSGIDKQKVGEIAAKIRSFLKPEPYKGKGIKYEDEHITLKPKKTGI